MGWYLFQCHFRVQYIEQLFNKNISSHDVTPTNFKGYVPLRKTTSNKKSKDLRNLWVMLHLNYRCVYTWIHARSDKWAHSTCHVILEPSVGTLWDFCWGCPRYIHDRTCIQFEILDTPIILVDLYTVDYLSKLKCAKRTRVYRCMIYLIRFCHYPLPMV